MRISYLFQIRILKGIMGHTFGCGLPISDPQMISLKSQLAPRLDTWLLPAAGSAALLAGAHAFEAAGYHPCELCLWQRVPHMAVAAIVLLVIKFPKLASLTGCGLMFGSALLAGYHVGVEQGVFEGLNRCSATLQPGRDPAERLARIMSAPISRCSEVAWSLIGISMAGWNMILSGLLAALWLRIYIHRSHNAEKVH